MKKAKKILVSLLTLMMLFSLLSGCTTPDTPSNTDASPPPTSGNGDPPPSEVPEVTKDPVTIVITFSEGEISLDQIAEFEAEYDYITLSQEAFDEAKLAAALATGTAPEIIRINGAFETANWVTRGVAQDITEYIRTSTIIDMDDLLPIVNVYRFDGQTIGEGPIYGLPKDWSNDYAVFYNKRCFEAANVEVPDASTALTWLKVMELAKQLTIEENGNIVQYGLSATEWGQTHANFNIMMQYIVSAGASISSEDNKTMNFDIPEVRDFLNMWVDAAKSNVGPNVLNNDQTSGGDLFLSNRSAMIINGYWYSGVIRGNEDTLTHLDDFGMLPTPIAPNGTRVAATGGATGGIINAAADDAHKDAAWKFLEWYCAGSPADARAATGWGMPIFKSKLDLLPQVTEFDKQVLAVLNDESKYQEAFLPVNPYLAGGGWGILDKYIIPLMFGEETIDGAVEGMTHDANVVVSEAVSVMGN